MFAQRPQADGIVGFCNEINEGSEPRNSEYGTYFLRVGDEKVAVTGLPNVPEEFRSYVLSTPVEATVTEMGPNSIRPSLADWKFKDTPVTLDVGSRQGIRAGMQLYVTRPRSKVDSVIVTKADEFQSEAIMTQIGVDSPGPQVGWRLSTRAPWNARRNK